MRFFFAAIALFITTASAAAQIPCRTEMPVNPQGHWSWRLIDGKRCWYAGPNKMDRAKLSWGTPRYSPQPAAPELQVSVEPVALVVPGAAVLIRGEPVTELFTKEFWSPEVPEFNVQVMTYIILRERQPFSMYEPANTETAPLKPFHVKTIPYKSKSHSFNGVTPWMPIGALILFGGICGWNSFRDRDDAWERALRDTQAYLRV